MASPNVYPSAFAPLGPDVLANGQNYLSGAAIWLDSATGSDANAGTEPELPKATLAGAVAVAAAGDAILCQPNHAETIAVAATLSLAGLTIVGMGLGTARPRFTSNVAGALFTITGAYTRILNCYFPASTAATTARVAITTGEASELQGCYFECGVNDTTNTVTIADLDCRIEDCDFVATASRPARAINITGAVAGTRLKNILLDGGAYGWASAALNVTAAATRMFFENVRLANRSDAVFTTTGSSYQLYGVRSIDSTGSRVVVAS